MTYPYPDTNLARIHDQLINDYAEGNTDPDPDAEPNEDAPPWVDDYDLAEKTEETEEK